MTSGRTLTCSANNSGIDTPATDSVTADLLPSTSSCVSSSSPRMSNEAKGRSGPAAIAINSVWSHTRICLANRSSRTAMRYSSRTLSCGPGQICKAIG